MSQMINNVIDNAIQILRDRGWCQGYYARDIAGKMCEALSDVACTFCAKGAIQRAIHEMPGINTHDDYRDLYFEVLDRLGGIDLVFINDYVGATKEDVITTLESYRIAETPL